MATSMSEPARGICTIFMSSPGLISSPYCDAINSYLPTSYKLLPTTTFRLNNVSTILRFSKIKHTRGLKRFITRKPWLAMPSMVVRKGGVPKPGADHDNTWAWHQPQP